ncbi:sensor histidine kinase [Emcibacter nanhaiensis]|uniref:histidine kinase n=1 Tax=Emcibacter nanhaiensis TaxID=1505037 RepID=A0A501PHR5_9PROT|nr:HAMP domain-containing sensor histidine kinase [Emcibacter nanhaiensis]TPD60020.1 HAMP domain-containing histidine kinase [Emcibacter nanhaiensis]
MKEKDLHKNRLELLGEMSSNIIHELNQPLNVIKMAASNLANFDGNDRDYVVQKALKISSQIDRISHFIGHISFLYRQNAFRRQRFFLGKALGNIVELMRTSLELKNISLDVNVEMALPYLDGDIVFFEQALLNLVLNAKDAILQKKRDNSDQEKITIIIKPGANEAYLKISVIDTGIGVTKEIQGKVFDSFFTTKKETGGSGVGLSLSQNVVQYMGGRMYLESSAPGKTIFTIVLPIPEQRDVIDDRFTSESII